MPLNRLFPWRRKCAEVVPICKKNDEKDKSNYRPKSHLSNISKVYGRCIQEQVDECLSELLSKYQCGFRLDYETQNCCLVMIEKLRKIWDKIGIFAVVLTDFSKGFDCISHNLLIAKLSAYGFDRKSLIIILAYLKSRKQRTRIGSVILIYIYCMHIYIYIPGYIVWRSPRVHFGLVLFILFLSDLFYFYNDSDYASYADVTTPYVCRQNYAEAIEFLESTIL